MRRVARHVVMVVCSAGFLCASSWAQLPKAPKQKPGGLEGQVVTAKGAPVADAQILWQVADGETPHVLHSDAHGQFHIERLRTGFYDLRASANGAWSEWEHNVLVRPGADTNVTMRLAFKPPVAPVGAELKGTMRIWDAPVSGSVPRDSAIDASGNVWFTLEQTGHIARFDPNNEEWKLFKIPTADSAPPAWFSTIKAKSGSRKTIPEKLAIWIRRPGPSPSSLLPR